MNKAAQLRDRLIQTTTKHATAAYREHALRAEGGDDAAGVYAWRIEKPGTSIFAVQIVALTAGALLVHGDIDAIIFQRSDRAARDRPYWLRGPLSGYVEEKARIGSGNVLALDWCAELFLAEAEDMIAGYEGDDARPPEWLVDMAAACARGEERDSLLQIAFDGNAGDDMELVGGWGELPSTRLIYAHTAINKLCDLLDAKAEVSFA